MAFCKNCGCEIEDEKFCPNCGTAVEAEQTIETTVVEDTAYQAEVFDATPTVDPGKGKGMAALILGIVSLALGTICSCGCASPLTLITSIIGMILGSSAKKASKAAGFENGKAKIGFILSIIALILNLLCIIGWTLYMIIMAGLGSSGFLG